MRVVIAEDEALLREGLALLLEQDGHAVVGTATDVETLLHQVHSKAPDLVVTDIRMPPTYTDEGLRAALTIRRTWPQQPVLVLSQHVHRRYALELMAEGTAGIGYLLKQRITDLDTFRQDVRRICAGGTVLDPEVVSAMVARARRRDGGLGRLTPRQHEVLELIAAGRSNASIARRLSVTERAVVQHASHIYDALGLAPSEDDHRRVLAALAFLSR